MDAVILNGTRAGDMVACSVSSALAGELNMRNVSASEFMLRDLNIRPCRSCGSCGFRSPGRCISDDDMPAVIKHIASSPLLLLLTPVTFGGYSSELKKAVDRLMVMGLPLYTVRKGHLLHPTRYENPVMLLGVGVAGSLLPGEAEAFGALVGQNALNMLVKSYSALVLQASDPANEMKEKIRRALGEVILH